MINTESGPAKPESTPEQQKQKEIDEQTKKTKGELGDLKSFVDNIKDTITNFWVMLWTVFAWFKSFFSGGRVESNNNSAVSTNETTPTSTEKKRRKKWHNKEVYKNEPQEVQALLQQPMMNKVNENKVEFAQGVCRLAHKHGGKPEDYVAVMYNETAGTMSPSKQNPDSKATWLFQFMPDTARAMGTTIDKLKRMSNVEQLEYVDKYIVMTGASWKINSLPDLYMVVFFPAALAHKDDPSYVFETNKLSAWKVARANPMFNSNKDGRITMREFRNVVNNTIWGRIENIDMSNVA